MPVSLKSVSDKRRRSLTLSSMSFFVPTHGLGIRGRGGRGTKRPPSSKSVTHISYNDETWHSYTLSKEDPKNIWITWHTPCVLLTSAFFTGNQQILLSCHLKIKVFRNKGYDVIIFPIGHEQNFITWPILYCKCGNVTKVW